MSQIPQGPPVKLIAGDSVTFSIVDQAHSSTEWALSFTLFASLANPIKVDGAAQSDGSFLVALTGPQTPDSRPVEYITASVFTKTGSRETVTGKSIWIIPDPTQAQAKSPDQLQLDALQSVQLKLSSGANSAVGMNGQTFTKKQLSDVNKQIVYIQARIIKEQEQLRALLDLPGTGRVVATFENQSFYPPFPSAFTTTGQ